MKTGIDDRNIEKINEFSPDNLEQEELLFSKLDRLDGVELERALSMMAQKLQDKYFKG